MIDEVHIAVPDRPTNALWEREPPQVALTLRQPWAWAVCYAGKRVENRGWTPKRQRTPFTLAIHAGVRPTGATARELRDRVARFADYGLHVPETWESPASAERERRPEDGLRHFDWGAIVAVATVPGFYRDIAPVARPPKNSLDAFYFFGPVGWRLEDVFVLPEPVPARGRQSVWPLLPETRALVHRQLRATAQPGNRVP